jgi:hypothetical protein
MKLLTLIQLTVIIPAIIVSASPVPDTGDDKEKGKGEGKKCVPGACPKNCPKEDPVKCLPGDHKCSIPGSCTFVVVCENLAVACGVDTNIDVCVPKSVTCASLQPPKFT